MNRTSLRFTNDRGHELAATLDMPNDTPLAYALAAHCFTCTKNVISMSRLANGLTERGIAVFRFDFTGLGDSDGSFAENGFHANLRDIANAVAFMTKHYAPPSLMFGHSLGGTAVLATAGQFESVKLVATIGSPYQPSHAKHFFPTVCPNADQGELVTFLVAGREFTVTHEFVKELDGHDMNKAIRSINAHLLVFHDPDDDTVEIDNARKIFEAARHPKSFITVPSSGHFLKTNPEDAHYIAAVIQATFRHLIGAN